MDTFPKGAEAGTLLHEVLEEVSFADVDERVVESVALEALARVGLSASLVPQIQHVVRQVADAPLRETNGRQSLSQIPQDQFLPEMEFTLDAGSESSVGGLDPEGLSAVLREADPGSPLAQYADRAGALRWRTLRGFLRGFIDAIFFDGERYFVIDYKSNYLGARQGDYRPEALVAPMIEHDYVLQYLLYTLALDRHLARTLQDYDYETHFGGAYYLFLRGLSTSHEPDCGVFFDRPSKEVVESLRTLVAGESAVPNIGQAVRL